MYTKEQEEQFARDRAFMEEAYREARNKKASQFYTGQQNINSINEERNAPSSADDSKTIPLSQKNTTTGNSLKYEYLEKNKWIKVTTAICCGILLISFFLSWVGKDTSAFKLGILEWSPTAFIVLGIIFKGAIFLYIFSIIAILIYTFTLPKNNFPVRANIFLGLPAISVILFLASTYSVALITSAKGNAIAFYLPGFWIAFFVSMVLLVIGAFINPELNHKNFTLPQDSKIVKYVYYIFILSGVGFACAAWPLSYYSSGYLFNSYGKNIFDSLFFYKTPIFKIAWPYILSALIIWTAFYKQQFIRVWFHLVSFYTWLFILMNLFWKSSFSLTVYMFNILPYAFIATFFLSYIIGRKRKCPSCNSLYGKKLISYHETGTTDVTYKGYTTKTVGEHKMHVGSYHPDVMGKRNSDIISVGETRQARYHNYTTNNICKNCGYTWTGSESHKGWYKPM